MAEIMTSNQDLFTCPVCLDILWDPVTIPCGHNYCMDCIKGCLDQEDHKGVYSCPQCRHTFTTRPVLYKNNVFAELVEQFRKTRIQAAVPAPVVCAGPGEVECDVCAGRKLKAVKSCLDCLLSYCETHYKVHNDVNPGRKHKVVDATGQLQERICTQHEKPLEIFCRTDQSCVCLFCLVDDHKGHDTVSASTGKMEKQDETHRNIRKRIQEREKKLQKLRTAVETIRSSAQTAVEDTGRIFSEMICSIERRRSEVKELIRVQERAEVIRAEGVLKQLEQEIFELKRREAELEKLSHTQDHIHYLKTYQSVGDLPESKDLSIIDVSSSLFFNNVRKSVSTLKGQLEDFCKKEFIKISTAVTEVRVIFPSEPTTREEFLQYSCHFTLDPNTANRRLPLSEGNRSVKGSFNEVQYPDHPERFDGWSQVLCREGVSGCCYWEVEWSGEVSVAISHYSIDRKGRHNNSRFGFNDQSWSLRLSWPNSSFWYNNIETKLPLHSSRIGVYVDHRAGILAFYSISDTMTLLHRIQTTFTQPLYPGFGIAIGSIKLL